MPASCPDPAAFIGYLLCEQKTKTTVAVLYDIGLWAQGCNYYHICRHEDIALSTSILLITPEDMIRVRESNKGKTTRCKRCAPRNVHIRVNMHLPTGLDNRISREPKRSTASDRHSCRSRGLLCSRPWICLSKSTQPGRTVPLPLPLSRRKHETITVETNLRGHTVLSLLVLATDSFYNMQ
jgi:hypothetical protein